MQIVSAMFGGAFIAAAAQYGIALFFAPEPPAPTRQLPSRMQSLLRYGELRTYVVRTRPTLPRRSPGAAIAASPPVRSALLHVNELVRRDWTDWVMNLRVVTRLLDRPQILGTNDAWEAWWRTAFPYAPRHSREKLSLDVNWRTRWAQYPTMDWPTLELSSDPSALTDPDIAEFMLTLPSPARV